MLTISPSRIARYFYHECERYLAYTATPKSERLKKKIPSPPYDYSPVTSAILEGGYKWEEAVITSKIKDNVHIAGGKGQERFRDYVFNEEETVEKLSGIRHGEYIYQACLIPPKSFYDAYKLDNTLINMTNCYPDLIYADNGKFQIIDLKASSEMKMSHKVQVTLYSLILSHILQKEGIEGDADLFKGGVWLQDRGEPEWFNINTIRPQIEEMLLIDLPGIAKTPPEDCLWHVHYRCEWCEYYEYCRKEAEEKKSVSLIPYLTPQGRKYLASCEVNSLEEMTDFLKKKEASLLLSRCASLSGRKNRLLKHSESLLQQEIRPFGSSSVSMPVGENIRLLLTLQREPVSGYIYACAFSRIGQDDIFTPGSLQEEQFIAPSPDECRMVTKKFVISIYEILKEIHDYNKNKEWNEKKSLQTYVFDFYEWKLLRELLLESLKDREISSMALSLLFYFHSEDLFAAEEHPDTEASFPVVILTGVIRSLFAMPVPVSYQLGTVLNILSPEDGNKYKPMELFCFSLSNSLRPDIIHSLWYHNKSERIKWIADELKMRLRAEKNVIDGIRAVKSSDDKPFLFAWPPKFSLPPGEDFNNSTFSRLAFMVKYESIMGYLSMRESRTLPKDEREKSGLAFILKSLGNNRFLVTGNNTEGLNGRGDWLLSEDTPEGDMAQMSFPDYFYKDKPYLPRSKPLYSAGIEYMDTYDGETSLILNLRKSSASPEIIEGRNYLLQPRFSDWNSNRVYVRLREIDIEGREDLGELLENPGPYCRDTGEDENLKKDAMKFADEFHFTKSQKEAFVHLIDKTLTLVWGPPGTGKTHFIAVSLLSLLEVYRKKNKPLKILLSAFTHAAIENCLKKILELNEKWNIWKEEFALVKLDRIQTQGCDGILSIPAKECCDYLFNNARSIVGGTTYSMFKAFYKDPSAPFDMIVLDEGSQVRIPEALLTLSRLVKGGRILIAGDDKQLPPIIQGYYPEPERGEPLLHRSIFECLKESHREEGKITCQLLENFRMNETLCLYPAKHIYGEGYKSFNKGIGRRKLSLKGRKSKDRIVESVIDPSYPMVICVYEGIRTGAENLIEAEMVADITMELRKRLCCGNTGEPYDDNPRGDRLFWKEGLFIVSPHHVQIDAIKYFLSQKGLREPFFVDTVDKMQGQECDGVIVSYGVSDPELAMTEGEFIYSLNRLNVAITRARGKSIVFLSRHLLTPTIQTLDNSDAIDGISYMIGLERFAAEGETLVFELGSDVRLIVYRR